MKTTIRLNALLALLAITLLSACSSSSSPPPIDEEQDDTPPTTPTDTTAPTVSATNPANGDSDVARDVTLSVTFDEAMDVATINSAAVAVGDDQLGESVGGSVDYVASSNTATFTPAGPLALAAEYTATVSTGVTDAAGNALAAEGSVTFRTVDGTIGDEATVNAVYGDEIDIAVDALGNALIVWASEDNVDPFADNLLASRYDAASDSYTAAVAIDTGSDDAEEPSIAGDADGNALLVWTQPNDTDGSNEVLASRYDAASGSWTTPTRISTAGVASSNAKIGLADDGTAIAAWSASDGINPVDIMFSVYDPSADSWSAPDVIDNSSDNAFSVSLAVNGVGEAVAAWEQLPIVGNGNIVASVYSGGSWSTPASLNSIDTAFFGNPQVGVDDAGNALVAWDQEEDATNFLSSAYAAAYDAATASWGSAIVIDESDVGIDNLELSMDRLGNAVVVFTVDEDFPGVAAVRYSGGAWGAQVRLDDGTSSSRDIVVASDPRGNALAVWVQGDGAGNGLINTSRYTVLDDAWGSAVQADFSVFELGDTAVAIGVNGDAVLAWYRLAAEEGSNVASNVFN